MLCHIRNRPSYDVWIKVDEKRKTRAKYTKIITIIQIFNNFLSIFSNNGMYNHQNKFGLYKRLEYQFDIFRLMKKILIFDLIVFLSVPRDSSRSFCIYRYIKARRKIPKGNSTQVIIAKIVMQILVKIIKPITLL